MEEHLRTTHMAVVRPDETLGSPGDSAEDVQWKMLDVMMKDYTQVHPQEMRDLLIENKAIRESMLNEHASGKTGLRWGFRLPPGLVRLIDRRFPGFLVEKRNIHKFMERYQAFRVCEIV